MPHLIEDVDFGTHTQVSGNWAETLSDDGAWSSAVLMVGIAGRDSMIEKIGALEARHAVDRCLKRLIRVAEAHNGRPVETPGRDLNVGFDQVDVALQAAIEMQSRIADLPSISATRLTLKIGLAYGVAAAGCESPTGEMADRAATLAEQAESGQILACIRAQHALSAEMDVRFSSYCREWANAAAADVVSGPQLSGPETAGAPVAQTGAGDEHAPRGLILKCEGKIYVLDENRPVIKIGRADDNHVVLKGRRVSRHHATIKRQGNNVVLTDTSANGTFFSFQDEIAPLRLVKGECVLHGSGMFAFAAADPNTGVGIASARFEIL